MSVSTRNWLAITIHLNRASYEDRYPYNNVSPCTTHRQAARFDVVVMLSFSDAKSAEDSVQDVVGDHRTDDFTQLFDG